MTVSILHQLRVVGSECGDAFVVRFLMAPFVSEPRMIRVQGLFKEFDDPRNGIFRALDNVSFEVRPGEIYGLLGPNGAGKTTCLRILSTVLRPTRGLAEVDGINVVRNPEGVRSRIGFMSCNTGIYDRMTAWEMVEYYGRLYGIPEEKLQARITEIFNVLQMNDIRDRLGGKMSTGMKQKVSIARTIVHDPPVIIFDEPTSGLDVLVARAVLQAVSSLRDQGKCIIFSTHIMREVEKLCNRIGIIHRGKILAEGTLPELADKYQQPDVEELFFDLIQRREEEVRNSGTNSEA
ncbi:MAG: ATP-binding cassette domain-containing protein [Planctomycetales bacterium]|jgi:sodium transport system ATP-binding protein|nr:ATP-binding cassette domain-containing protein [Planctomycetales bacterium]